MYLQQIGDVAGIFSWLGSGELVQESSHSQGTEKSRVSRAFLLVVALLTPRAVESSRSPGAAHYMPPRLTWAHRLLTWPGKVTPSPRVLHHQPLPVAPALLHTLLWCQPVLMVLPWLPTEGANDRRLELPVTRKLSARPSASPRVVPTWNPTKGHIRTSCKRGPTLRKPQVILTPKAWTHASCTTSWQPFRKQGTGPWTDTSAQSGKNWSSTTGRCPGRLTFTSGVSSVRQPEHVGPPQQSSALPFLRFADLSDSVAHTRPDRAVLPTAVTHHPLLVDAQGDRGVQRCAPVRDLLTCRGTRGATYEHK